MDRAHREAIAKKTLALSTADETEVLILSDQLALSRFTRQDIHQNIASNVTTIRVRVIQDQRCGVATTTVWDDVALQTVVAKALTIAGFSPRDEHWCGLPHHGNVLEPKSGSYVRATAESTPQARADLADAMFRVSEQHALWDAGYVSTAATRVTLVNSHGRCASFDGTESVVNIKENGVDATGYAEASFVDVGKIDASNIANIAATKVALTAKPQRVEPGTWKVILEPAAFGELLSYLTDHFSAQSVDEGSSFLEWSTLDHAFVDTTLTMRDDWAHPLILGMPFDYEGSPRTQLALFENGIARNIVTDSRWAARLKRTNTGHALPAPDAGGPQPLYVHVEPGSQSLDELIADTERGLYITRFWYIRPVDRRKTIVTGMTRDGTSLIRDGKLVGGVHNLRFNQSILEALKHITLADTVVRTSGLGYTMVVPAVRIEAFNFSSSTSF